MGFRSPNLYDRSVPPRIAERMSDISGGRAAAEAQLDADRWLDEGGALPPEAIAEAVEAHFDAGADHVCLQPLGHGPAPVEDYRALGAALL
jgi:hypothetical protein